MKGMKMKGKKKKAGYAKKGGKNGLRGPIQMGNTTCMMGKKR
jgi:hypothetical protein